MKNKTTRLEAEIQKFEKIADQWWNPGGEFKPLHELTPTRLEYIINLTKNHFKLDSINNIKTLDIGCGGGLISEPLARLKAKVTGIDASEININIAKNHAIKSNLEIDYRSMLAEDLEKSQEKYDLILALEIIEHVENIEFFIETCCKLLAPNGLLIFSTINQTIKSFLESIVAAEYILRWVPKGTHQWSKFIKPSQINGYANKQNMQLIEMKGLSYSPISRNWSLTEDLSNNYFISFSK
jgi:2-polyprenyl-6-hydroxyphenyl methylase / 3-demethylubiquinone-9 3-methyltransferase